MKRYIYPIIIFLLLALYVGHLFSQHSKLKSREAEIYASVKSRVESAHNVLLNSPIEPLFQTYGRIWEGSGIISGFNTVHFSARLNDVARLNQEIESEFFSLMLQNNFNEDRVFFINQLADALKVLPEKASLIDSVEINKQLNQLHANYKKYMSEKYDYYK